MESARTHLLQFCSHWAVVSRTKGRTMKTKNWMSSGLTLTAVAALALGLAACGGDDNTADNNATPTPAATGGVVNVSGDITTDTTWTADNTYLLQGAVFVRQGATLTIQAGTQVVGEHSSLGTLVVARGGHINAIGTREAPIVFTSDRPVGSRARGDWGGLILNGSAPLNVPGGVKEGEGDTGEFGGNNVNDNSGTLRYVRVEYAGIEFSPDNELNGIAFQGVGAQTTVDHIQVHFNLDDAMEFFGGTVNVKYALATAAGDDSFDWTDGWRGKGQFWIAQQKGDDADNGFECDNLEGIVDASPRSNPTIYNVTLVGSPGRTAGDGSTHGMVLRRGTAGTLRNFIILGFKQAAYDVRDASVAQAQNGALSLDNAIIYGNGGGPGSGYTAWLQQNAVVQVSPELAAPYNLGQPNFMPASNSPAVNGTVPVAAPPNDGFFEQVNFIGGMGSSDWTEGWTTAEQS